MSHRQTVYDSIIVTKDTRAYEICRLMLAIETSYDSEILTKVAGVKWALPIDGDQWKAEKTDE